MTSKTNPPRTEFNDRNRAIARAVLNGASVPSIAQQWALSSSRCCQLVHEICRRVEPELYRSLRLPVCGRVPMAVLRKYREAFIKSMDDDSPLTLHSPIRRIRELPSMTKNALLHQGIHTVQDLKECRVETLERVPVIGHEGLKQIQNSLHLITHI